MRRDPTVQYLTMDIGGSSIKYALARDNLQLTEKGELPTQYDTHATFVETLGGVYDRFAGEVDGIALSCCGELDPATGHMFSGGALTFNAGTNMIESVRARCCVPVSVENDANCALLAEANSGCLVGCRNAVALIIGTGVGGAILLNGAIYHGSNFHAGNASFAKVNLSDPDSASFAITNGVGGLVSDYAELAGVPAGGMDGRFVFELVQRGDSTALAALDRFCQRLSAFVFNLQVILDVEAFAIGGGISAQPVFVDTLREKVAAVFDGAWIPLPRPQVRACAYFNDANLIGALHHHLNTHR